MPQERIPTRAPDFLLERLDDQVLLHHPGLTKTIQLNETAALIWDLCDGERSEADIAGLLAEAYPEEEGRIQEDLAEVLQRLASECAIAFR